MLTNTALERPAASGVSTGWSVVRLLTITRRVLRQLAKDRRFLGLSLVAPLFIMYVLKIFFDSLGNFAPTRYIVPVGAFIVHFLTYILCAIVLVRERKAGTLSRMFINGFRRSEIILGYLLAYSLLATVQITIVLLELVWLFNLNFDAGVYASLYLVIWLLAIISISLGIFLSNFADNEGQMLPTIPLVILPSVFLSGLLIDVEKLPGWLQPFSYLTPVYYANQIVQTLTRPGGTLGDQMGALGGLLLYGAVVLSLATFTLKEQE